MNQVISRYIGRDDRAQRDAIEQDFLQRLGSMGGCAAAKKKQLRKTLEENYRQLFGQVSELP